MRTVAEAIEATVRTHPDARIVDREGVTTFREIDARASALASALASGGLQPSDRVAVVAANSRWSAVAYIGVWKSGGIPVPINTRLTVPEVTYIFEHAAPSAVIADEGRLDDCAKAAVAAKAQVRSWFSTGAGASPVASLRALPLSQTRPVPHPELAGILYTSGTTGRPKGVMLTHDNVLFAAEAWRSASETTPKDVVYCGLPTFHVYALVVLFLGALVTGNDLVLENGFELPRVLRVIEKERVTFLPAIPPVFQALVALEWNAAEFDLSSLRLVLSSAAPMPAAVRNEAQRRLGGVRFLDAYGITECGPLIALGPLDLPQPEGASGRPVPGVDVRICGPEREDLGRGHTGEICVKSPGVMRGYYRNDAATVAALADGWYRTGDLGYLDDEGRVFVCDRLKDLIKVNGENVYPREVEAALLEHPGIASAAVIGMETEDTGEAPLAFVVVRAGLEIKIPALMRFLRERIAVYKLPRRFEFVDAIPISASGKILRRLLERPKPA